ncbi:hypothetical protein P9112_006099 [Eukaryota sp. TZLM1-RC]
MELDDPPSFSDLLSLAISADPSEAETIHSDLYNYTESSPELTARAVNSLIRHLPLSHPILTKCEEFLQSGCVYIADVTNDDMELGQSSSFANNTERYLELWEEMKQGSEIGLKCQVVAHDVADEDVPPPSDDVVNDDVSNDDVSLSSVDVANDDVSPPGDDASDHGDESDMYYSEEEGVPNVNDVIDDVSPPSDDVAVPPSIPKPFVLISVLFNEYDQILVAEDELSLPSTTIFDLPINFQENSGDFYKLLSRAHTLGDEPIDEISTDPVLFAVFTAQSKLIDSLNGIDLGRLYDKILHFPANDTAALVMVNKISHTELSTRHQWKNLEDFEVDFYELNYSTSLKLDLYSLSTDPINGQRHLKIIHNWVLNHSYFKEVEQGFYVGLLRYIPNFNDDHMVLVDSVSRDVIPNCKVVDDYLSPSQSAWLRTINLDLSVDCLTEANQVEINIFKDLFFKAVSKLQSLVGLDQLGDVYDWELININNQSNMIVFVSQGKQDELPVFSDHFSYIPLTQLDHTSPYQSHNQSNVSDSFLSRAINWSLDGSKSALTLLEPSLDPQNDFNVGFKAMEAARIKLEGSQSNQSNLIDTMIDDDDLQLLSEESKKQIFPSIEHFDSNFSLEQLADFVPFTPSVDSICECIVEEVIECAYIEATEVKLFYDTAEVLNNTIEIVDLVDELTLESALIVIELQTLEILEQERQKFRNDLVELYTKPLPCYESIHGDVLDSNTIELFKTSYTGHIRSQITCFNELVDVTEHLLDSFDQLEDVEEVVGIIGSLSQATAASLKQLSKKKKKKKSKKGGQKGVLKTSSSVKNGKKTVASSSPQNVAISISEVMDQNTPKRRSKKKRLPETSKALATPVLGCRGLKSSLSTPSVKSNIATFKKLNKFYNKNGGKFAISPLPTAGDLSLISPLESPKFENEPQNLEDVVLVINDEEFEIPSKLLKESLIKQERIVLDDIDEVCIELLLSILMEDHNQREEVIANLTEGDLVDLLSATEALKIPSLFFPALDNFINFQDDLAPILELLQSSFSKDLPLKFLIEQSKVSKSAIILDIIWFYRTLAEFCACHQSNDMFGDLTSVETTYFSNQNDWLSIYSSCRISNFLSHFPVYEISNDEVDIWAQELGQFVYAISLRGNFINSDTIRLLVSTCPNLSRIDLSKSSTDSDGVRQLVKLECLLQLNLAETKIKGEDVVYLTDECPHVDLIL